MTISRKLLQELERRTGCEIILSVLPGGIHIQAVRGLTEWHGNYISREVEQIGEAGREQAKRFWAGIAQSINKILGPPQK